MEQAERKMESNLAEAEAIEQAKAGVATAFEYLYKAHSKNVYGVCLRMLKNAAEAEDLTQQAFLQLFRKIATFRGESGFATWLHRVTVNLVLMHLRRRKPKTLTGVRELQIGAPSYAWPKQRSHLVVLVVSHRAVAVETPFRADIS